uniref:Putative kunitz-type protease inhibitor (inferred by orthology to a S. mansoni protein) n=1 Tax=Anisakis simplex TaxID=6269 RepID=A0A0M3J5Q2_ANISI
LTGLCHPFWYDGCLSTSQNIFNDRETCQWLCEMPSLPSSTDVTSKDAYRCLEEKSPGMCKEKYPAYFYNKETRRCEPFAYSGCAGNGNRFLTLQQCESICNQFRKLSVTSLLGFTDNEEKSEFSVVLMYQWTMQLSTLAIENARRE